MSEISSFQSVVLTDHPSGDFQDTNSAVSLMGRMFTSLGAAFAFALKLMNNFVGELGSNNSRNIRGDNTEVTFRSEKKVFHTKM